MIDFQSYINDLRLSRLLRNKSGKATLCLWILEEKNEYATYHLLYGRLLSTNFANNKWSGSDGNKLKDFNGHSIRVLPISINISTKIVPALIKLLLAGNKLSDISTMLSLDYVNSRFKDIIKDIKITIDAVFSPVSFLLPRNSIDSSTRRSLSSDSSCYSGLILNGNKIDGILSYTKQKDEVFSYIIDSINNMCGLMFDENDAFRLGALEIVVIPNFDDNERNNVYFGFSSEKKNIEIIINKGLKISTSKILCTLNIHHGGRNVYSNSSINRFSRKKDLVINYSVDSNINGDVDCYIIELSFYNHKDKDYVKFFNHEYRYIKSISVNIESIGTGKIIGQNWFSQLSSDTEGIKRARQLGTISRDKSKINIRAPEKHGINFIDIENSHFPHSKKEANIKTNDCFFEHYQDGNSHARLDFSEWYIKTIHNDNHEQVIIFDPYYEDAGLYLLIPNAKKGTEYIIFTTMSAPSTSRILNDFAGATINTSSRDVNNRIKNLESTLIDLGEYLKGIKLSIYALPAISPGKPAFHDRYHLIKEKNGIAKGFHFSNSLQKANENYPLLITAISEITLSKIIEYADGILKKIGKNEIAGVDNCKIFDSKNNLIKPPLIDKLNYLHSSGSDELLAAWSGDKGLIGFTGDELITKLKEKNMVLNESLQLSFLINFSDLKALLESDSSEEIFNRRWAILCLILAHNNFNDSIEPLSQVKSEKIKELLLKVIDNESYHPSQNTTNPLISRDLEYFAKHSIELEFFSREHDYKLSWSFRYALDHLIINHPDDLIKLFENIHGKIANNTITTHEWFVITRLTSKLSLYLIFNSVESLVFTLIKSKVGILQWFGFLSIRNKYMYISDMEMITSKIGCHKDIRFRYYTWLLSSSTRESYNKKGVYIQSDLYLTYFLWVISNYQNHNYHFPLVSLVKIFSGNLNKISWLEPALSEEIISPLIEGKIINYADVSSVWFQEIYDLISALTSPNSGNTNTFSIKKEGVLLDYCVLYISKLSNTEIKDYLSKVKKIVNTSARIIRIPLSRSINWSSWDNATKAALIAYKLCEGIERFIPCQINELKEIMNLSSELIEYRTHEEWLSMRTTGNEYAYLFDEVVVTL